MKVDNSPARGTRDLLPDVLATRRRVLGLIQDVYLRFGYQQIETPALERIERLTAGQGGDNEKLLFRVLRRGLNDHLPADTVTADLVDMGLRYDLTVPLARFYAQYRAELPAPFRSFQFGPVWRAERPQKGRYRQFYQCDIDLLGEASVLAEVELIEATTVALAAVGLSGATVRLSDRRFLAAFASAAGVPDDARAGFFVTVDKLDKIGWDGVTTELTRDRGLPAEVAVAARDKIVALTDLPADKVADAVADTVPGLPENAAEELATTAGCLAALPGGLSWAFDPTLVRGMGYYTGQIFEVTHPAAAGSIAGGGRYDELIGRSLGQQVPACGFSIGFERIVDPVDAVPAAKKVAVLYDADVPVSDALLGAATARRAGHRDLARAPQREVCRATDPARECRIHRICVAGVRPPPHQTIDTAPAGRTPCLTGSSEGRVCSPRANPQLHRRQVHQIHGPRVPEHCRDERCWRRCGGR